MLTAVDIGAAPPTTVDEETARVIPETDSEDEIEAQRPLATKLSIHPQRNNRKGSQGGYGPGSHSAYGRLGSRSGPPQNVRRFHQQFPPLRLAGLVGTFGRAWLG
jgi:hypothetical protein